ncbi:TPA: hypothetical protein ACWWTM_000400 [Enterococcus faecium]|uniref:Uncharacterized protein n=2 Tax=Enterococcus TaxID=1350 RepID=A0A367CH84_9ENTE|nr:hypothetical protein [Enterococcus durans]EMF0336570.1 hypothetical protein [Enterococcus faecium]NTL25670.1 hypothetical protein [Enterococcus faecium]RCA11818.1 hypothetical protein EA71_00022 [Enterococcus durans]
MKKNITKIDTGRFQDIIWKIKKTKKGKWVLKHLISLFLPYQRWDRETIKAEFDYSLFYELNNGKKRYSTLSYGLSYEDFLLKDCSESELEIKRILSNSQRATKDRFFEMELNMKRRSQKDREKEFEKRYGNLSIEMQEWIKKNHLSSISRYEERLSTVSTPDNVSIGVLSDNVSSHQRNIEMREDIMNGLNTKDIILLTDIVTMVPEKIAKKQGIKLESANRQIARLHNKVINILKEST